MNKKETLIPIVFVALSLLFIAICTMHYLSKGKSAYWLKRKMKIGALLLTLSYFQVNSYSQDQLCYKPIENKFRLDPKISKTGTFNLQKDNIVIGTIYRCTLNQFSFALFNEKKEMVQKGNLIPVDGVFNAYHEDFKFEIDKTLKSGRYTLLFFNKSEENQNIDNPKDKFYIFIKNE